MVFHLLLIDKDLLFLKQLKTELERTLRYKVSIFSRADDAFQYYLDYRPNVVISEESMFCSSGKEAIEYIREINKDVLLFFSLKKKTERNIRKSYEKGADECILKPYTSVELDKSIQDAFNQIATSRMVNEFSSVRVGGFVLDKITRRFYLDDVLIAKLSKRESDVFLTLSHCLNEMVTRSSILMDIWEHDDFYTSRSLDIYVLKLRKLLKLDTRVVIETFRGEGLRLVCYNT